MKKTTILFALVLTLVSTAAFAGGPLANCSSGVPYRWGAGGTNIPFNPDQGDLGPLTHAQAVATVQAAFDVWGAVGSSTVSYAQGAVLPVDVTSANFVPYYDAPAPDGLSAIVFDHNGAIFNLLFGAGSGVLGFAGPEWGIPATCTITEGLSFLNGPSFTNATAAMDVMVHEYGHYTNLAHTAVNGQIYLGSVGGDETGPSPLSPYPAPNPFTEVVETMYPFYYGPGIGTQTLAADDIASVSSMYPDASFAARGTIRGTIFAANGTTRLSGVNVIARNEANPFHDAVSAVSGDWTDATAQTDAVVGTYTLYNLTPGASYRVYVDEILAGGFSTPPIRLPGPEEYYSVPESSTDPVASFQLVTPGATGVNVIFNRPQPGDRLPLTDDSSVQLPLPFQFKLCEQTFDAVFVNSNGNLTFGSGSTDLSESSAELLSLQPRIAGWWDDLNPNQPQAKVFYSESNNDFTVTWSNVPEFSNTGSNTFSIRLRRASNGIDVTYGAMTAVDGLAGVSCGGAITSRSEAATDLSSYSDRINFQNQPAAYEVFTTANRNDLAGRSVLYTGSHDYNDNWAGNNDTLGGARSIAMPFNSSAITRYTEIEPAGNDIDFFRVSLSAGTSLVAETTVSNLDTMIVVANAAGVVIGFDDDSGPGVLSRAVVPIAADGEYYVGVTTWPDTTFVGAGAGTGRYILNLFTVVGDLVNAGDDTSTSVPLGFSFPFQGATFTSVFVNSNGNLTFGGSNTDLSESVLDLRNGPRRVAALWDDLNPSAGGLILVTRTADSATIRWDNVPEFATTNSNNFAVTLRASGEVNVSYGAVGVRDALVGVSQGGGVADPGESNLSGSASWPVTGTTYELFTTTDPFDLALQLLNFVP